MNRAAFALAAALLLAPAVAHAQAAPQPEVELWTEVGAMVEPVEDLELGWSNGFRFVDGAGQLDKWLNDLSVGYRFNKSIDAALGYRLTYRPYRDTPCCRHRPHAQTTLRAKVGKLRGSMRVRFQTRFEVGKDPRFVLRDRLKIAWRGHKVLRPYVSTEVFARFFDDPAFASFQTWRGTLGFQLRAIEHVKLETYYRFELPGDPEEPLLHIIGLAALVN
jgi:hypothetical protein